MKLPFLAFLLITPVLGELESEAAGQKVEEASIGLERLAQLKETIEICKVSMSKVDSEDLFIAELNAMDARLSVLEPIDTAGVNSEKAREVGIPDLDGLNKEIQKVHEKFKGSELLGARSTTPIYLHVMGRCLGLMTPKQILVRLDGDEEMLESLRKISSVSRDALMSQKEDNADMIATHDKHLAWIDSSLAYIQKAKQIDWLKDADQVE